MKKIICFYWQGDRWQDTPSDVTDPSFQRHQKRVGSVSKELASQYVNNLYLGTTRWTKEPFQFICFTNEDLHLMNGIERRPFKPVTSKGVLPRMYMFSKEAGLFGSQVLSLDIDLIITGSLDDLLRYDGLFCTRKSWTRGEETLLDGDIMSFKACEESENIFWNPIVADPVLADALSGGGRERFWVRQVMNEGSADTWDRICPGQVVSYKHHVMKENRVPDAARIISCHGYPRPHQIMQSWREQYWK